MRAIHVHLHRAPSRDARRQEMAPLYADLWERMGAALRWLKANPDASTGSALASAGAGLNASAYLRSMDAEWREDLHPRRSDGKFGTGEANGPQPKPTSVSDPKAGGMDKIRELLSSGHAFTKAELMAATGLTEKRLSDYLAMLKNPKWAGKKGALSIERKADGGYYVALPGGEQAPPPEAPKPPTDDALAGFDAARHERLSKALQAEVLRAHRLSEQPMSHHAGERAKSHLRTASDQLDQARRSNTAALTVSPEVRAMYQDKAEQSIKAARGEIEYGEGQLRRAAEAQARATATRKTPTTIGSAESVRATEAVLAGSVAPYQPQKTAKEAGDWAVMNGYVDQADFGRVDARVANDYFQALGDHLVEFPQLRTRQGFAGSIQSFNKEWVEKQIDRNLPHYRRTYPEKPEAELRAMIGGRIMKPKAPGRGWAFAHRNGGGPKDQGGITWNEKYMARGKPISEIDASLRANVLTRWHPPGCDTLKSIADHELGHQLDNLLGLDSNPRVHDLLKRAAMHTAGPVYGGMPVGPHVKENIKGAVSAYAATNVKEFIAEAWAEYRNSPDPRFVAAEIGAIVKDEYAKKFGSKE